MTSSKKLTGASIIGVIGVFLIILSTIMKEVDAPIICLGVILIGFSAGYSMGYMSK
jgi:uncharacterized membrane protein